MKMIDNVIYKITGIPQNYQHLVDILKTEGTTNDIDLIPHSKFQCDGATSECWYDNYVTAKCGNVSTSVSVGNQTYTPGRILFNSKMRARVIVLDKTIGLSDKLKEDGFSVTINQQPSDVAKEAMSFEEIKPPELKEILNQYFPN
jgi:hypothetical protein|tara:strand:- start:758 stop:1192 length:435 start_codon:yes stop_codon:yes gene_type:complete